MKKNPKIIPLVFLVLFALAGCGGGAAESPTTSAPPASDPPSGGGTPQPGTAVLVSWEAPVAYLDGTPLQVGLYRVYTGSVSGSYTNVTEIPAGTVEATLSLESGDWFVSVSAVDLFGNESALSNEMNVTI